MFGSEAVARRVALSPSVTSVAEGEQLTVGGRFFLRTVISVVQLAWCLPSETVAVQVYLPGATPVASKVAVSAAPVTRPPLDDHE